MRVIRQLEYRFVVPGHPVSFRSPNAKQYKKKIRGIARRIFCKPRSEELDARIDYFHDADKRKMDMDNISKCVLDALNGVAYTDDRQVTLQSSEAYNLSGVVYLPAGPVDLVKPLRRLTEYLFVRLRLRRNRRTDQ